MTIQEKIEVTNDLISAYNIMIDKTNTVVHNLIESIKESGNTDQYDKSPFIRSLQSFIDLKWQLTTITSSLRNTLYLLTLEKFEEEKANLCK